MVYRTVAEWSFPQTSPVRELCKLQTSPARGNLGNFAGTQNAAFLRSFIYIFSLFLRFPGGEPRSAEFPPSCLLRTSIRARGGLGKGKRGNCDSPPPLIDPHHQFQPSLTLDRFGLHQVLLVEINTSSGVQQPLCGVACGLPTKPHLGAVDETRGPMAVGLQSNYVKFGHRKSILKGVSHAF